MMADQPPTQVSLGFLPNIAAKFRRSLQPPLGKAVVANQLAAVEQGSRIGASVKDAAPIARLDTK
jgi:hypothetical protein